ncbi:hypothetical protein VNO77_43998 [Canavalia gladiata]|uniref:Uncharacterized protein n=1 Tax=Canavalia gladiata TaxID=3824 RepID=A0AAN9PQK0_CANGL
MSSRLEPILKLSHIFGMALHDHPWLLHRWWKREGSSVTGQRRNKEHEKSQIGEASSSKFILQYMPSHEKNYFTNYVNEYVLDSSESSRSSDPNIGRSVIMRLSCLRTITSLALIARVGMPSYSTFQEVPTDFLSGLMENHVSDSLDLFIEGKASGWGSIDFLSLLGLP